MSKSQICVSIINIKANIILSDSTYIIVIILIFIFIIIILYLSSTHLPVNYNYYNTKKITNININLLNNLYKYITLDKNL